MYKAFKIRKLNFYVNVGGRNWISIFCVNVDIGNWTDIRDFYWSSELKISEKIGEWNAMLESEASSWKIPDKKGSVVN